MRPPRFFLTWCAVVLAVFALAKEFGYDAWPFAAGAFASASSGGGGSSGTGGGGYGGGSPSHK